MRLKPSFNQNRRRGSVTVEVAVLTPVLVAKMQSQTRDHRRIDIEGQDKLQAVARSPTPSEMVIGSETNSYLRACFNRLDQSIEEEFNKRFVFLSVC